MRTLLNSVVLLLLLNQAPALADAELFLRVSDNGRYTVVVDDQQMTVTNGRFRFFDLRPGRTRLTIVRNNTPVFQDVVDLRNDFRSVAEFNPRRGIRLVDQFPLFANGRYCGPDWSNPYGNSWNNDPRGYDPRGYDPRGYDPRDGRDGRNNGWGNGRNEGRYDDRYDRSRWGNGPYSSMNTDEFDLFRRELGQQAFDDRRFDYLRTRLPGRSLSSLQLAELLRQFSFDKQRLEAAKLGWACVSDRQGFTPVFETFSFDTSVRDLKRHIGWPDAR